MAEESNGTEIWEADGDVRELASDIIAHHHPHLADANFVLLMRSPAAKSKGKLTLGTAKKASPEHKALYTGEVDFIITLAGGEWRDMTNRARRALLDHELCHCVGDSEVGWSLRGHDVEEFGEIIERHGLWHDDLKEVGETVRQLDFNAVLDEADRIVEAGKRGRDIFGEDVTVTSWSERDGKKSEPVTMTGAEMGRRMRGAGKRKPLTVVGEPAQDASHEPVH